MSRSIVDEFPLPFDQPMAQALLRFMIGPYPLATPPPSKNEGIRIGRALAGVMAMCVVSA